MEHQYAYVNGQYVPEDQAVISINDRGFRFGDGVFETIHVGGGQLFLWSRHMQRLQQGLIDLKIGAVGLLDELPHIVQHLLKRNGLSDGMIRVMITRGVGSQGYLPRVISLPTLVVQALPLLGSVPEHVDVMMSQYPAISEASRMSHAKTMQGLLYSLVKIEAAEHHCHDAIICNEQGYVCEVSSGNIFWRKGDQCFTPSMELGLVGGVMRQCIIEHSPLPIKEGRYTVDALIDADELLITNVTWPIMSVGRLVKHKKRYDRSYAKQMKHIIMENR